LWGSSVEVRAPSVEDVEEGFVMSTLLIRRAKIADDREPVDIRIEDGRFSRIGANLSSPGLEARVLDAAGRVVLPGFVESHIHPDKAFLEERMPNVSGTLEEAILNTGMLKKQYTLSDVTERARKVLRWAITRGTTVMRAHPDVDTIVNLLGVRALLELRQAFDGYLDLQIAVFPQEGIYKAPGTLELMEEGLRLGCEVVGGCPYNEATVEDTRRHIEAVFELAERHGKPIDLHLDFADDVDDPRFVTAEMVCDLTIAHGMQGKVCLGHVTTLGALDVDAAAPLLEKIARAGITIVSLPATDLYLNGRKDKKNVRRGQTPVRALLDHGVNVAYSSNNIRNAFTPFGNGDLVLVGYLLAETQFLGSAEQQRTLLGMVTTNAARALGIEDAYGIEVGKRADLVVLDTQRLSDVIQDQPVRTAVIKAGRVVIESHLDTRYPSGLP
jgi:cytosine/creatinine deaminase